MDLSCIISSGDLELYVLGALSPEEAAQVETLAQLFPEIRSELDNISISLQELAEEGPRPADHLRAAILSQLQTLAAGEEEDTAASRTIPFSPAPVSERNGIPKDSSLHPGARVVALPVSTSRHLYTAAASVVALLVCGAALLWALNDRRMLREELAATTGHVNGMNAQMQDQALVLADYQATMGIMHDPAYRTIRLAAVPTAPANSAASVMWNASTQDMYVANLSLPDAPAGKQYQLWAIVDGKPVDAGMMDGTKGMARKMKSFAKAEAFAITLEKKGGNPSPTMEAMYVMGKA